MPGTADQYLALGDAGCTVAGWSISNVDFGGAAGFDLEAAVDDDKLFFRLTGDLPLRLAYNSAEFHLAYDVIAPQPMNRVWLDVEAYSPDIDRYLLIQLIITRNDLPTSTFSAYPLRADQWLERKLWLTSSRPWTHATQIHNISYWGPIPEDLRIRRLEIMHEFDVEPAPAPEPAAWALGAVGLIVLGIRRRIGNRQHR